MSMKRIRSQTKTFKVIQKRTLRNFSKCWSYETFWNEPSYGLVDASRTAGVDTRWHALTRLHSRGEHQYYSLEHSERSLVRLLQGLGARRDFIKEIKQRREIIFFKPLSKVRRLRKPQEKKNPQWNIFTYSCEFPWLKRLKKQLEKNYLWLKHIRLHNSPIFWEKKNAL